MYEEQDYLLLSGLQHFAYCPRQWALIHVDGQWADSADTVKGKIIHKKAHNEQSYELRGNSLVLRGLRISSRELGVSGQCDVVEFTKVPIYQEGSVTLKGFPGWWIPCPVEYKKGNGRYQKADELQLVCEALCLEEMLQTRITHADLFYSEIRERVHVIIDAGKRASVRNALNEMRHLYESHYLPRIKKSKKCINCSLQDICMPQILSSPVSEYITRHMKEK